MLILGVQETRSSPRRARLLWRRNDFACAHGESRAPWRSRAFENTAVRLQEDILSHPKTSEQNTSSRFSIVDGKTSISSPASAFFVDNEEG